MFCNLPRCGAFILLKTLVWFSIFLYGEVISGQLEIVCTFMVLLLKKQAGVPLFWKKKF
jgi:hypothetical protein